MEHPSWRLISNEEVFFRLYIFILMGGGGGGGEHKTLYNTDLLRQHYS